MRAPGSKVTFAPRPRAGLGDSKSGSTRTVPVNQSEGPFVEGCDPARVVNLDFRAHLFTVFLDAFGDVALFARVTVDLHKFEQKILDAFLVDH